MEKRKVRITLLEDQLKELLQEEGNIEELCGKVRKAMQEGDTSIEAADLKLELAEMQVRETLRCLEHT